MKKLEKKKLKHYFTDFVRPSKKILSLINNFEEKYKRYGYMDISHFNTLDRTEFKNNLLILIGSIEKIYKTEISFYGKKEWVFDYFELGKQLENLMSNPPKSFSVNAMIFVYRIKTFFETVLNVYHGLDKMFDISKADVKDNNSNFK